MKITAVDVAMIYVPFIEPVEKVGWRNFDYAITQLRTDEGLVGLGEIWGGDKAKLEADGEKLIGQDPLQIYLRCTQTPFQMALYDLVGQALGLPVWRLFGDKYRDLVPVAYWSCHLTPEETAKEAEKAYAKGFRVHKLKALSKNIVRTAELITKATGPDYAIRVDPNCEFGTVENAIRLARQLEPYNIECYEDPIPHHDHAWYRLLRQKQDVPVSMHLGSPWESLQAVSTGAVDRLTLSGGVHGIIRCAAVAEAAGIPVWHQILGLPLGIGAAWAIHAGCTIKNATLPCDELPFVHENDLIGGALPVENGCFRVPDRPGLGVQLDEAALKHYRID